MHRMATMWMCKLRFAVVAIRFALLGAGVVVVKSL